MNYAGFLRPPRPCHNEHRPKHQAMSLRKPRRRSVAPRMRRTRPVGDRPCVAKPGTCSRRGALYGAAGAIAILIALIATACGESKSEKEAGRYADSLCTNISTWESQIGAIAVSLGSGSSKSVAQSKLDQAETATVSLVRQIHDLELPDVDGADEAKQNVDHFVTDSNSTVAAVKAGATQIESYGTGTANVATVAVPLGVQLANLAREGKSTVSSLESIKGPFEDALKNSDACQELNPQRNEDES